MKTASTPVEGWCPLLQIVHVSDLHACDPSFVPPLSFYQFALALHRLSADYAARLLTAVVPHDPFAVDALAAFLPRLVDQGSPFAGRPVWLVDSGDATSFGDAESFALARQQLEVLRQALSPAGAPPASLFALYGNHDAWPADQPLNCRSEPMERHYERVREHFRDDQWPPGRSPWPVERLRHAPDDDRLPVVDLYGLDTVVYDRWRNFLAVGEVADVALWQDDESGLETSAQANLDAGSSARQGQPVSGQLRRIAELIDADEPRPHLRIVASHHPPHFPPPRPGLMMHLADDRVVGEWTLSLAERAPRLWLSGHVHVFYPPQGALPPRSSAACYPPLAPGVVPLLVGSLSQTSLAPVGFGHQAQVLRLYARPGLPLIRCERLLLARASGLRSGSGAFGAFAVVPLPDGAHADVLELELA